MGNVCDVLVVEGQTTDCTTGEMGSESQFLRKVTKEKLKQLTGVPEMK